MSDWISEVCWNADGLVPVVAQDAANGQVLMCAWMNEAALRQTVRSGEAVYFSRSRSRLWRKGEESGNTQKVVELRLDCDGDTVLMKVEQGGGIACHTGRGSCFYRVLQDQSWVTVDPVLRDPASMYGTRAER
jgi:phosphoribosyl-AMP cyclohydrolase